MSGELVLVTGGTGFVGVHCIAQLLEAGYRVRTTVRTLSREADVHAMLHEAGAEPVSELSFATADLLSDAGWADAVAGCDYVLHVASPFPMSQPKDENELIVPAREGALRVLRAARDAGVRRAVLTSSFAAIGYGHTPADRGHSARAFTEDDWTNPDGRDATAYVKSKTLAERAAWDFIEREGGDLQLATVNPVVIFGPALGPDMSTSLRLLQGLLTGTIPALPRVTMSGVDVRDVADLHLRAMTHPDAAGQRFAAAAGDPISLPAIAALLRQHMGDAASRVPTRVLPDWLVRALAPFNPSLSEVARMLGQPKRVSSEKARRMLGWSPRSKEEAILAAAESLVSVGVL